MNLTGQSIASTYNTLVTLNGYVLTDGTGSQINSLNVSASYALTSSYSLNGGGGSSVTASYALTSSFIMLYNPTTGTYYKISVSGSEGFETLQIG